MPKENLFVANLKCNLNLTESLRWLKGFLEGFNGNNKVVICPEAPFLLPFKEKIQGRENITLGIQNISQFEEGQYTGEISARALVGITDYAIVGHSERRKYFKETDAEVRGKIALCQKYGIMPIVCVSNESEVSELLGSEENFIVAYEPLTAIGTGEPESPEEAEKFSQKVKEILGLEVKVLYGGSVNSGNVKAYLQLESIEGVLVGGASLDIIDFVKIVN
ncbi:triose-phosphate isomerase [candidate division WWE3 bacterium CG08_land_8_20_14_0_20_41_15]|uniref:Triosephosphate isomerase n=1 Tax=candidate division WWE3 bacterium CG08_land_8_20_14_0_20_41_15 TaxID=1975086 RepID=A0A2H0XAI8_UNCKA|nr:MAG: triose-phosphate isomerase [candidate division WWE3 bacterium CG08_land_8_20_14_0_20_41_15]